MAFSWPSINTDRNIEYPTTIGGLTEPDRDWRYVDKKGHGHFYDPESRSYPTLKLKYRGCNDPGHDFECEGASYFRCRKCKEEIEPRRRAYNPPPIIGPTTYRLSFTIVEDGHYRYVIDCGETAMVQIGRAVCDAVKQVAEELNLPTNVEITR